MQVEVIKEVPFIRYVDKVVNKEVIVKRIQVCLSSLA